MYTMTDGEEMNKNLPTTFEIPSLRERTTLKVGDCAKVTFKSLNVMSESMWVLITKVVGEKYVGTLNNYPNFVPLTFGEEVQFAPKNVINIRKYKPLTAGQKESDRKGLCTRCGKYPQSEDKLCEPCTEVFKKSERVTWN